MLNVKYAGFGGYMEVPCYKDEKGKMYFDENTKMKMVRFLANLTQR